MADRDPRQVVPDAIQNAPELLPGLLLYLEAFKVLTTCRPVGFSEGRIPWTAVVLYMNEIGLDDEDDRDYFVNVINYVDIGYLNHVNAKLKKSQEKGMGSKKPEPRRVAKKRGR